MGRILSPEKRLEENLGNLVTSTSLFDQKIKFVKARRRDEEEENIQRKFGAVNGYYRKPQTKDLQDNEKAKKTKIYLFSPDFLSRSENWKWPKPMPIGPGLHNMGNTCFLNSVLQCLLYTAPLCNYLRTGMHSKECKIVGFCSFCEMEKLFSKCLETRKGALEPTKIVQGLRVISRRMKLGRQEDSHEFLRCFIESLQKNSLFGLDPKIDAKLKETTIVYQMFGGHLQSQITCSICKTTSDTVDPFLDLSLDIRHSNSVIKSLETFVKPEFLRGSNQYHCSRCQKKVDATKKFSITDAPLVLTLHLKRFSMTGQKIPKFVEFKEKLDLTPFMSKGGEKCHYELYAILVHSGSSCNSGHYYSFVKNSNNLWYCMNDSSTSQVGLSTVLKQNGYIFFYKKVWNNNGKSPVEIFSVLQNRKSNDKTKPLEVSKIRKENDFDTPPNKKTKVDQNENSLTVDWDAPSKVKEEMLQKTISKQIAKLSTSNNKLLKKSKSIYGSSVDKWDPEEKVENSIVEQASKIGKVPSKYDQEYDKGKLKKKKLNFASKFVKYKKLGKMFQNEQNYRNLLKKNNIK
ncbi:cysteine proteinase [Rozella allomycis CSF55]|uniref:Ubiquitin carboxyl-terminal hydrolase n=1 Tax=Rozella allomycis (strain CSF55) TaxID=988480 RepID=A0A075B1E5_ROZAC|nr:Peptidase C19, ubiquitin carboxyl-terminal hydrolase 2 domain-containing protein [Rozella allomycis CSF55]RKP21932.1 cysteine proteinase [Rozella allomycis CSF55]|eukprot:EPZ36416.1 Peptidase C19, ubiquitin carboxyl-terminal hydrolase 2 domain-containing protein [Rozella allomycis CSF55]